MKESWGCCFYSTAKSSNFSYEYGRAKGPDSGGEGLSMGKRWLLNGMMYTVLSSLSFTDGNGISYFDWDSLEEAMGVVESGRGNAD